MNWPLQYSVRVGMLGRVAPFAAAGGTDYPPTARVLCRTPRGLEVGRILTPLTSPAPNPAGELVRVLTEADEPHLARLALRSKSAYRTCSQWLRERRQTSVLMDVEHSFDGRSLIFYFTGGMPVNSAAARQQLAAAYGAQIEFCLFEEDAGCDQCSPPAVAQAAGAVRNSEQLGAARRPAAAAPAVRVTGCSRGGCDSCAVASVCGRHARMLAQW